MLTYRVCVVTLSYDIRAENRRKTKKKKNSKKVLTKVETRGKLYIVVAQDKRTTDKRERLREA